MTAKTEILEMIAAGHNTSRSIADHSAYSQEYIRRIVADLAGAGQIEIVREPRGHTYVIKEVQHDG